jgi:hypothetical protein
MLIVIALVLAVVAAVRGVWSPCGLSMLSSLNPVSEAARGNRYWLTTVWYVVGGAIGGAVLGAGCALGALALDRLHPASVVVWAIALAAAVVAVGSDSTLVRLALPVHPRQVDERWLVRYRRWIYAAGYGVQIGTGFATYVMTAAVYLVAALAVLTASPAAAFAIGLTFGAVRGLAILVTVPARTPALLRSLIGAVDRRATLSLRVAAAASAAVGAAAAGQLGGPIAAIPVAIALAALVAAPRRARVAAPVSA